MSSEWRSAATDSDPDGASGLTPLASRTRMSSRRRCSSASRARASSNGRDPGQEKAQDQAENREDKLPMGAHISPSNRCRDGVLARTKQNISLLEKSPVLSSGRCLNRLPGWGRCGFSSATYATSSRALKTSPKVSRSSRSTVRLDRPRTPQPAVQPYGFRCPGRRSRSAWFRFAIHGNSFFRRR